MRAERLILAAILITAAPNDLQSQAGLAELRVRVRAGPGVAAGGALLALIDASDRVVAEGLSSENGGRMLAAPAGTYRVRVRRIGFQPFFSGPVVIPRSGELAILVESPRVVLSSVLVTAKSRCRKIDGDTQILSVLWSEITKALRASQLTMDDVAAVGSAWTYRKEVDDDGRVVANDTTIIQLKNKKPFGAPSPSRLAQDGYVSGDQFKGWEYSAPDEAVLLSQEFQATHCFRAQRSAKRPAQIALAFEPLPGREIPDIAGSIWLDEATSELRDITFQYANAGLLSKFEAGGATRFRRMKSGAWLVDRWHLRAPRLIQRVGHPIVATGYYENGGGFSDDPVAAGK